MPFETVFVICTVVAAFSVFGLTLAFADLSTAQVRRQGHIPAE